MDLNKTGLFISALRKQKDMTQKDLAERIGVTDKAVSRWETGKGFPDVSLLTILAGTLDVSVSEIVMGEKIEVKEENAIEIMDKTVKDTLDYSQREIMKSTRWKYIAITALCLALVFTLLHYFPVYRIVKVWSPPYYNTDEISLLAYIGDSEDRNIAESIIRQADTAFSDFTHTYEENQELYGLLSRYAESNTRGIVRETHSLKLWSAHFGENRGDIWVYYSQESFDDSGNTVSRSYNVPALWHVEKNTDGKWVVTAIREHP